MKKRIVSIVCMAAFAAVVTFGCIGTETAEASQQGTAAGQQVQESAGVQFDGPYLMETTDGIRCFQFDVYNYTDENIFAAVATGCIDESFTNVETLYSYVPCIAPNSISSIYVVDYTGLEDISNYIHLTFCGESEYVSASDDLYAGLSISLEDGYLNVSAFNLTSETIWLPQINVQFYTDEGDVCWADSASLAEAGTLTLSPGSGGFAKIVLPQGTAGYCCDVTGLYKRSSSDSESAANSGAEDYDYSDSDYFKSSDMILTDPSQNSGEVEGQN